MVWQNKKKFFNNFLNKVIGIAETGSGKTLAFMLPALMHIIKSKPVLDKGSPKILVIAPTRELALQIEEHTQKILIDKLSTICIYGGASRDAQVKRLNSKIDIGKKKRNQFNWNFFSKKVVGTPGRMIDLLEDRKLHLKEVSYLVFDEADRMLDMGFEPQIRRIIEHVSKKRQTLMFSATWPREVKRLASDFLKDPIHITIGSDELSANKRITQ